MNMHGKKFVVFIMPSGTILPYVNKVNTEAITVFDSIDEVDEALDGHMLQHLARVYEL